VIVILSRGSRTTPEGRNPLEQAEPKGNQLPISQAPPRGTLDFGDAYRQNGQAAEARECFNQALALVPGNAAATLKFAELDNK
jgi:hypothetical protein